MTCFWRRILAVKVNIWHKNEGPISPLKAAKNEKDKE